MRVFLFSLLVVSALAQFCPDILMTNADSGIPTQGGPITLTGAFYPFNAASLSVRIGAKPCLNVRLAADKVTITCDAAAGVARSQTVRVSDGKYSASISTSYGVPIIRKISSLPAAGGDLVFEGINFGDNPNYVKIFANGQPCVNPKFLESHKKVSCTAVGGQGQAFYQFMRYDYAAYSSDFGTFQYNSVNYSVAGYVKNAVNNSPVSGATVVLQSDISNMTTTSDALGVYKFVGVSAGTYKLHANAQGYNENVQSVNVNDNIDLGTTADLSLSPVIVDKTIRAVLKWGIFPVDLDSHFYTDTCEVYSTNCGGVACRSGIEYFHHALRCTNTTLDVDCNTSYGPETVTIRDEKGSYQIYWFPNPNAPGGIQAVDWSKSQAEVTVYGASLPNEGVKFTPPLAILGKSPFWNVFNISGGVITPFYSAVGPIALKKY